MNSRRTAVARTIALLLLAFFFLFTPVRYVRYIAILYILLVAASFAYSRMLPYAIWVDRVNQVSRGIKLQDIELKLRVRNRTMFPIPYFTMADSRGKLFTKSDSFLLTLGPFEEKVVSYTVQGHTRGDFSVGPVRIEGSDPFGLFTWQQRLEAPGTVIVYPTIHPLDLVYKQGLPSGSLRIDDKMYEDVTQFRSLREYVPGDDMKRINWKASAKTSKLFTMEFDSTLYFPVMVVLNFCRDDYPARQREALIERAAELAASVPFFYAKLKQEIGFISTGNLPGESGYSSVPMKAGYEHAQGMLELISKLTPSEGHADFNEMLYQSGINVQMGTKVIVVSPPFSHDQADVLIAAKRKGMNLLVLQIESQTERVDDEYFAGALSVVSVRKLGGEVIHG
jgi:uncharacterized protein (DUF58 family)